jgi:hypothetical protein
MAERAKATIEEVPASDASFVSQPEATTRLILTAIEATSRSAVTALKLTPSLSHDRSRAGVAQNLAAHETRPRKRGLDLARSAVPCGFCPLSSVGRAPPW